MVEVLEVGIIGLLLDISNSSVIQYGCGLADQNGVLEVTYPITFVRHYNIVANVFGDAYNDYMKSRTSIAIINSNTLRCFITTGVNGTISIGWHAIGN